MGKHLAQPTGQDYSTSQMDPWNKEWRAHGSEEEGVVFLLKALLASIDAAKAKSDKFHFVLPKDIRGLIRPLLNNSLGE